MVSPVAITVTGLTRRFGRDAATVTALQDVDLAIELGEMVALMGPSGSGKSTLLQLLGALDSPDAGSIVVADVDITTLGRGGLVAHRRRTGFVFQRFNLLPALTALDNVLAPVLPYRVEFDKVARARELLADVGLAGRTAARGDSSRVDQLADLVAGGRADRQPRLGHR
jgi:putative ABC transport system ATP-binding protein